VSGGHSKWDRWKVLIDLPQPVSNFVRVADLEAAHLKVTSVSKPSLKTMPELDVKRLLDVAFTYHRTLGFPYPAPPSDKRLRSWVNAINNYIANGKDLPVENAGLGFCSAYMPHRFNTKNADADFSALGAYLNDDRLHRTLRFCLSGDHPNLRRSALRSALTSLNRTPMQFRPAVAKVLIDTYAPLHGMVLDPCAGWGGRLLGTLLSGRKYVGVEPVKLTVDALWRMGNRLCESLSLDSSRFTLLESQIQSVPDGFVSADMALTSPPYWTKEIYEGERLMYSVDYWVENFLSPMFQKVRSCLAPASVFVVNICDVKENGKLLPLEKLTIDIASRHGMQLEATWRMFKSSFGDQPKDRFEPLFVFRSI
jgi:hypothetical protein